MKVDAFDSVIGGEITPIAPQDAPRHLGLVQRRRDVASGKQRLMIAEPHDEERLVGKFALETRLELRVVVRAHLLAAQILVDLERISRIDPPGQEIGTVAEIPWKMIHREVDEDKYRAMIVILRDHARRVVVKKAVGVGGAPVDLLCLEKRPESPGGSVAPPAGADPPPRTEALSAVHIHAQPLSRDRLHA